MIVLSFCLNSCVDYTKNYTFRYNGKLTKIDSLIYVDGYYQPLFLSNARTKYLFYRDGTFAIFNDQIIFINENLQIDSIPSATAWGAYKIQEDTIKTQAIFVLNSWFSKSIYVPETWFKVISKDTLIELHFFNFQDTSLLQVKDKAVFRPAIRPDSSCWLKERKWAWENGEIKK